ncbi:MAG TPA: SPOR domain-containing protein [Vicinamibacterales bacterium]|nr:SPOR domain-containing protein [Vicinamibacterales bacterium]
MAPQIQDEGFHEIQLNGKQLVFLFMAATVVSVVIFLCGVLVGRGVRSQLAGSDSTVATNEETTPTPTQPATPAPAPAPGSDPTTVAAPPPPAEDVTYPNRLTKQNPPEEKLKPAPDRAAPAERGALAERSAPAERAATPVAAAPPASAPPAPPSPTPAKEPARAAAPPVTQAATSPEPSGQGFAVQIAALNVRSEADAIAKRLSTKGYAAYVMTPANGTPSVFRVRVGKFTTRREAETVAARLQKEEQFKPWVTR